MANAPTGRSAFVWCDKNGDGKFDADEFSQNEKEFLGVAIHVDEGGDIWFPERYPHLIRRLVVAPQLNARGAPTWSFSSPRNQSWPIPAPFRLEDEGAVGRLFFDTKDSVLYILGFNKTHPSTLGNNSPCGRLLVRYKVKGDALEKLDELEMPYDVNVAGEDHDFPNCVAVVGDYLWLGYRQRMANLLYRKSDLSYAGTTLVGEQSQTPLYDGPPEMIPFQRKNGEYLIFQSDYTNAGITLMRWSGKLQSAPTAPTELVGEVQGHTVNLKWKTSNGAGNYRIERATQTANGFQDWEVLPAPNVENPAFTDTTVKPGLNYAYRVRLLSNPPSDYSNTSWVTVR